MMMDPLKQTKRYQEYLNHLTFLASTHQFDSQSELVGRFPDFGLELVFHNGKLYYTAASPLVQVILEFFCRQYIQLPGVEALKMDFKEVDFYFRDKNSEAWLPDNFRGEMLFFQVKEALKTKKTQEISLSKNFPAFHSLKIIDKITLLKDLLGSQAVTSKLGKVELVDVEDVVIIVNLEDKNHLEDKLEWLQGFLSEKFQEPKINVIPEY